MASRAQNGEVLSPKLVQFPQEGLRKYKETIRCGIGDINLRRSLKNLLSVFTSLFKAAANEAIPVKVTRPDEIPWMNDDFHKLLQQRNRLRRKLNGINRFEFSELNKEIAKKTAKAKRTAWRSHLQKIAEAKNSKLAWLVVKALNGTDQRESGKTLVYKGNQYASDAAKATAFNIE